MKNAVVLGTRPEIIKMAPVIRSFQAAGHAAQIIHTGQHYSYEMDRVFFEELGLPEADHNLEVGSGNQGEQTARILERIERVFLSDRPDAVLVQGDTNTVLAGALAAAKLGIPVAHVEAGLRSFDRTMPEEINRVVADHVSTWLFPPTEQAAQELRREGIPEGRIRVTGNTIVDSVQASAQRATDESHVLDRLGLQAGGYVLLTAHRQENVDRADRFHGILEGARRVAESLGRPIVYPIHPRARKMMERFGLAPGPVRCIEPVGFLDFLRLERDAQLVLTDSGGVQEETCILKVPCVTLRDNTERPETVAVGSNMLAGTAPDRITAAAARMVAAKRDWANPFGDGRAAERIVESLLEGPPRQGRVAVAEGAA